MANKFLSEVLPRQVRELQERRRQLEWKQVQAHQQLEYGEHDCDCEYCDYKDYVPVYGDELEAMEKEIAERKQEIIDITTAIDRATAYKKWMEGKQNVQTT